MPIQGMTDKQILKRLRNGKSLEGYCRISEEVSYTISISLKENKFRLHSYNFDGNDVMDEVNYKDEQVRYFDKFDILLQMINEDFPNTRVS